MIISQYSFASSHLMRRFASLLIPVAATFIQGGCTVISGSVHEAFDQPAVNPAARDVLRITVISKTNANIRLQAGYSTTNPECKVRKWPGNPKVGHTKHEVFDVPTSNEGAVIEVLIDKYIPGRCLWSFGGMSVGTIVPGSTELSWAGLLAFSNTGSVPSKPLRIICQEFGPSRRLTCYSGINYLQYDVRNVTFETHSFQEKLAK